MTTQHSTQNLAPYITAMAPATTANIPPETRLTMPALVVGTGADELEAEALEEGSLLVEVAEELVLVLVLVLLVEVEVVMVVMVLDMLSEVVVGAAEVEVMAADEELGAALEDEAAVAPLMTKWGRKL